jgi:TonB family protein
MAMSDVRETYAQRIEEARLALGRSDRPAAAESLRAAVDVGRGEPSLERELASALVHLGKLEQELGRPADAERLLDESLVLGERLFGADHPSLGAALNELSRLHLRQSNHARARAVLERLLRIARAKGEEHPEVATALAGLGVAHRSLGDDAAAEQHFRDALRIREKVLAPNHMAIVVAMEQLSETCAERGNRAEALALLRRALPRRVAALGSEHATVVGLRSRIAALELREHPAHVPSVLPFIREHEPSVVRPPSASREPREHKPAPTYLVPLTPAPVPVVTAEAHAVYPAAPSRRKRGRMLALAGVAGAALAISAVALRPHGDVAAPADAEQSASVAMTTDGSTNYDDATQAGSDGSKATLQLLAPRTKDEARGDATGEPVSIPAAPKRLASVAVPVIAATNVDSLLRVSTKTTRESYADQIGTTNALRATAAADDAGGKPPVMIGAPPLPYFPDALRSQRTEGEVVVRFRVDEHGRVDASSMKVVKSDHELFTLAVRNVLPRFRFEPARSPAPESKPRAEWVDFRAEFRATN